MQESCLDFSYNALVEAGAGAFLAVTIAKPMDWDHRTMGETSSYYVQLSHPSWVDTRKLKHRRRAGLLKAALLAAVSLTLDKHHP